MKTFLIIPLFLAPLFDVPAASQAPTVASSDLEICPLKVGTVVPKVALKDLDGKDADLHQLISGKPTVLVFYRGGW